MIVPHIVVRRNKQDKFSEFKTIQGQVFDVKEADLSLKNDFLIIELDRDRELHFTVVWKKTLKRNTKNINIIEAFKTMVATLKKHPELIKQYASLPYFGEHALMYWMETAKNYPFNVCPPH